MIKHLLNIIIVLLTLSTTAQTPIDVVESTFKVPALEENILYYGFAEGDQIIINFEEVNGKELKEFEIIELPEASKFMEYKINKISNKTLNIGRTGIYKVRFSNTSIAGRICKLKIQRIPSSERTTNFNTNVYWKTHKDTTYTPVQERFIERIDTSIVQVVDQLAKVSSQSALNGNTNRTIVDFQLPEGTIAWSYYIGVGSAGKQAYTEARDRFLSSTAAALTKLPGYGTLGALALYGVNAFNKVQGEDNVKYWFITDWNNVLQFKAGNTFYQYKTGDVVNDAGQMKTPLAGKTYLGLLNDNVLEPIDVVVKVTAIQVIQKIAVRTVQRMNLLSRQDPYLRN
ncbi:hypothetical protein WG906_14735 [Pedobacter sp. P351]|uniref:hypothetical protein n=1 Tax=Pedobacter superstes TaxID=3133441 RepID=UPI0030AC3A32